MALISIGVDHEHASLDFLERTAVPEHQWPKVLRALVAQPNVEEAVFVSTCLRTEVVAVVDRFHGALDEVTATLAEATGLAPADFADHLTVHFDRGVATHLFSVAAGLKSVVPGEFEVLGQLRRALDLARDEESAGRVLDELFHRALASGRRVRAETSISRGTTSFAQAAVAWALEELGDELAGGVVRGLLAAPVGVARVTVLNRTAARARSLAADVADPRVRAGSLDDVRATLSSARLVVTALETPSPVINVGHVAGRTAPLLVIDLAMPRAVESRVGEVGAIRRVDIADLRERVERALDDRQGAVEHARELVTHDVERFLADQRARGAAGIVSDLRAFLDQAAESELARRDGVLEALTPEEWARVEAIVRAVVAKIAHRPTVALKEAAGTDRGLRLTEAARTLFDL
ncbi:MAG: glutamyl-tRNA reductase [Acidimicrobiales bacterium]